jgi:hypothetical protein
MLDTDITSPEPPPAASLEVFQILPATTLRSRIVQASGNQMLV